MRNFCKEIIIEKLPKNILNEKIKTQNAVDKALKKEPLSDNDKRLIHILMTRGN